MRSGVLASVVVVHVFGWTPLTRRWVQRSSAVVVGGIPSRVPQERKVQRRLWRYRNGERRTLRTRFVETCTRGWLRDARQRRMLRIGELEHVTVVEPDSCGIDRRCPDVVSVSAKNVTWFGRQGEPMLRLSSVAAETVNLHRRVLSRGRHGSLRATVSLSGADLDASTIWSDQFSNVTRNFLEAWVVKEDISEVELSTNIFEKTVCISGHFSTPTKANQSVRLELSLQPTHDGRIELHNVNVRLPECYWFATLSEKAAEFVLSNVEFKTSSFVVTDLSYGEDTIIASFASGDYYVPQKERYEPDDTYFFPSNFGFPQKFAVDASFFDFIPRSTFVLGDRLPWILNAKNPAPHLVVTTFLLLTCLIQFAAAYDELWALVTSPLVGLCRLVEISLPPLTRAFVRFAAFFRGPVATIPGSIFVSFLPRGILEALTRWTKSTILAISRLLDFGAARDTDNLKAPATT